MGERKKLIDYKDPNFGGVHCKCGGDVRIITDLDVEVDENVDDENNYGGVKYYKTTKFKCMECGNSWVYDKRELKIIDNDGVTVRFVEI